MVSAGDWKCIAVFVFWMFNVSCHRDHFNISSNVFEMLLIFASKAPLKIWRGLREMLMLCNISIKIIIFLQNDSIWCLKAWKRFMKKQAVRYCHSTNKSTAVINSIFTFSSGIDDNPTVFYQLIRGSTDQTNKYDTFYLQQRHKQGSTFADVKVNHPLNYERIKEYNLTIRVEASLQFCFGIDY